MAKKCFVLHEEVIDIFHDKCYFPTIEKLSFHLAHVRIIGSMERGKTENYCFHDNTLRKIWGNIMQKNSAKRPVYKYKVNISVKIDNLSMEGIAVEYIFKFNWSCYQWKQYEFNSYIIDNNEKYGCDSHAHMFYLLKHSSIQ